MKGFDVENRQKAVQSDKGGILVRGQRERRHHHHKSTCIP
jgi:hypothetical protein